MSEDRVATSNSDWAALEADTPDEPLPEGWWREAYENEQAFCKVLQAAIAADEKAWINQGRTK